MASALIGSLVAIAVAGTFLSNVGLAVSDWAKQNKTLFVAAEPLTEAITWSKGHDYVFRVRPNTYQQGRMLAERAGKMKYAKWATIGPNYEYGKRAWETFRDRLKELKPDVQVVGEQWPALGKIDASAEVGAVLAKNPEALYVSLFGSDWLAFVREAQKRGLIIRPVGHLNIISPPLIWNRDVVDRVVAILDEAFTATTASLRKDGYL